MGPPLERLSDYEFGKVGPVGVESLGDAKNTQDGITMILQRRTTRTQIRIESTRTTKWRHVRK